MGKSKYTDNERKNILEIRIKLAKDEIGYEDAKVQTLKVGSVYKIENLRSNAKSMKEKTLKGIGECNRNSYPYDWARILLEITKNDSLIIQALKHQQELYFKKYNKSRSKQLDKLLANL